MDAKAARWQHIEQLLDAALDRPPAERTAFLCRACPDDPTLRAEVQHLLDQAERALDEAFLAQPAARHLPHLAQHALALDEPGPANPADPADSEQTQLADPLVGQHLSHFKLLARLGRGGMGVVYRARDIRLDREVALKLLPPALSVAPGATERFLQEAQAAAALNHPNICTVYDIGETAEGRLFIAMELVEGRTLRQVLDAERPLPEGEAVRIATALVEALAAAHARGIVHRDVKPSNVMVTAAGSVKLMDFGIAKLAGSEGLTQTGTTVGTAAYMSPEQVRGEAVDGRSDLWSVGVVLYEMVTGQRPFRGKGAASVVYAVVHEEPTPLTQLRTDVPGWLDRLILKLLSKNADERPQRASELLTMLHEADRTPGGERTTSSRMKPRSTNHSVLHRKHLARSAAVVLLFFAGAAVILLAWQRGRLDETMVAEAAAEEDRSVLLQPFRVSGADPSLHYLSEGMVDLLAARLTGEPGPQALDPQVSTSALSRGGENPSELSQNELIARAEQLGAQLLISGRVVGQSDNVALSAEMRSVPSREIIARAQASGPLERLSSLADDLAIDLLGITSGELPNRVSSLGHSNIEAVRLYLLGRAAYRAGDYAAAIQHLEGALAIDSTFALAGLQLERATGFVGGMDLQNLRGATIAWTFRDNLSQYDRIFLEARVGPDFPARSSSRVLHVTRERAVELLPNSPEIWYLYGDSFYHNGASMGIDASLEQALSAFGRVIELDPASALGYSHRLHTAVRTGNTALALQIADQYFAIHDPEVPTADLMRWHQSLALRDTSGILQLASQFDAFGAPLLRWIGIANQELGLFIPQGRKAVEIRAGRTAPRQEAFERYQGAHAYAHHAGRLQDVLAVTDALSRVQPDPHYVLRTRMLDALYGQGDGSTAAQAYDALVYDHARNRLDVASPFYVDNLCVLGIWWAQHGELERVERAAMELDRLNHLDVETETVRSACVALLHALSDQRSGMPRLHKADSLMQTGPIRGRAVWYRGDFINLELARLWRRLGEKDRALAAVRRRGYYYGWKPYLSSYLLLEGQLAQETGDLDGAREAYRHYLALRFDPEPALVDEVARVRAELARLESAALP